MAVILTYALVNKILVAQGVSNGNPQTRDSTRKADLQSIYNALLVFFQEKTKFPPANSFISETEFASDKIAPWIPELTTQYISPLPIDPLQTPIARVKAAIAQLFTNIFLYNRQGGQVAGLSTGNFMETFNDIKVNPSPKSVIQSPDGGYVTVGSTTNYGQGCDDILLMKLNSNGAPIWTKSAGGAKCDFAQGVATLTNGEYIAIAKAYSYEDIGPIYMTKFNDQGIIKWTRVSGPFGVSTTVYSVAPTKDGGFVITGETPITEKGVNRGSDIFLGKFDNSGTPLWMKSTGTTKYEIGRSVSQTNDGGYIVGGTVGVDFLLTKFDANGNLTWAKTIGGEVSASTSPNVSGDTVSVQQTTDGYIMTATNITATGETGNMNLFRDFLLMKFNSSGNLMWSKKIPTTNTLGGNAGRSVEVVDDGYVIAADINNNPTILKFYTQGNLLWSKTVSSNQGILQSIAKTQDDGFVLIGSYLIGSTYNTVVLKTGSNGTIASCSSIIDTSPTVVSVSPTVTTESFNIRSHSPRSLGVTSISPTITTPQLSTTTQCQETAPSPTMTVAPSPTPISPTTPSPSPSLSTACSNKKHIYCYSVPLDRSGFIIWAQLENSNDKDTISNSTSPCYSMTPPSTDFNYCVKSP